jgi:DNA-binding PadR family transcriptional regulator
MENVILGLLLAQSLTLYDMNREFKQNISLFYSASLGSLQIAIKSLLIKGCITFVKQVERGRSKKVYSITSIGREAFFAWMMADTPISKLEVVGLSKVYFLGHMEDPEKKKLIIQDILSKIEIVQNHLQSLDDEIQRYEIPETYQAIAHYRIKTLDYGIRSHALAKQWFEELLAEM